MSIYDLNVDIPFSDQTAKNVMYIGGVHVIVNVMKRFQNEDLVHENACRALGSFASHGKESLIKAKFYASKIDANEKRHTSIYIILMKIVILLQRTCAQTFPMLEPWMW